MSENALRDLAALGVAVSYDNIGRELILSGRLARMIREDGIAGETANPIIYEKAVSTTDAYDSEIAELSRAGLSAVQIVMELWAHDVQLACDVFRPVYEATNHVDGYVSLELPPHLAHDAEGTIEAAREVRKRVDRPNLALKIPATREAFPAIEACVADGVNVNATVIFSRETYEQVVQAYRRGLERRVAAGLSLDVTSFASVFLSRYDAPVDELLVGRIREATSGAEIATLKGVMGRVSIANAWMITRRFREFFDGPEFATLRAAGARPQRPLWAGVVARNSRYGDVTYMEALAMPGTAITASDAPVDGFRIHGIPLPAEDDGSADVVLDTLKSIGIDVDQIALDMEEAVVSAFTEAFDELVAGVARKAMPAGTGA
ncbi:MAG: transaldolase family protein [Candidatus Limnocylindrales bacterium]